VPGALLGTLLYPLGLDAFVWRYIGLGIDGILWAARMIGSWPGSTLHLPAFAPWAIVFLTFAVLSSVLWRTALLRATAIPLAAIGLLGAAAGPTFDMAIAPTGDAVAYRASDNKLRVIAYGRNSFATEQWLRADADGRLAQEALTKTGCDRLGCVGHVAGGQTVSLIFDPAAFAEDCARADMIVTSRFAPVGCGAKTVIDREKLKQTGALTLSFKKDGSVEMRAARAPDEDRPWSPAPRRAWGRAPPVSKDEPGLSGDEEPENGAEPLD
jgi:competence protein ComEC